MTVAAAGVELGTPAWLEAVRGAVEAEAASQRWAGLEFSFSETLFAVPPVVSGGPDEVGFTCQLRSGRIKFEERPLERVEFAQRVEYAAARQLSGQVYGEADDPGSALKKRLVSDGRIVTTGSRSAETAAFWLAVHNRLASITLVIDHESAKAAEV